jgi:(S)-ureidoglycine aminohydrolase
LQTPDTFVRAALPGMERATAIIHAAPALGARFTQYTAEMEAGGALGATIAQRFVYVLEGAVRVGENSLTAGGYAYVPEGSDLAVAGVRRSRLAVIEKTYVPLAGTPPPQFLAGRESEVPARPLLNGEPPMVKPLLPDEVRFDFAVNIMTYAPGESLGMVEIHVMEHGLLMLAGSGIYRLGEYWYPVTAGDFIWMAPYCPQWFGALGKTPARYLIYKDWNRHPL